MAQLQLAKEVRSIAGERLDVVVSTRESASLQPFKDHTVETLTICADKRAQSIFFWFTTAARPERRLKYYCDLLS